VLGVVRLSSGETHLGLQRSKGCHNIPYCRGTSFAISSPFLESALAGGASAIIRRLGLFFSYRVEFGAFYDAALSGFVSVLARQ
jgi:hypothetical protein